MEYDSTWRYQSQSSSQPSQRTFQRLVSSQSFQALGLAQSFWPWFRGCIKGSPCRSRIANKASSVIAWMLPSCGSSGKTQVWQSFLGQHFFACWHRLYAARMDAPQLCRLTGSLGQSSDWSSDFNYSQQRCWHARRWRQRPQCQRFHPRHNTSWRSFVALFSAP